MHRFSASSLIQSGIDVYLMFFMGNGFEFSNFFLTFLPLEASASDERSYEPKYLKGLADFNIKRNTTTEHWTIKRKCLLTLGHCPKWKLKGYKNQDVADEMSVILFGILGSYLFLHIWENTS